MIAKTAGIITARMRANSVTHRNILSQSLSNSLNSSFTLSIEETRKTLCLFISGIFGSMIRLTSSWYTLAALLLVLFC